MEPARLLADVVADPWGSVSPSAYETGRLVADAPWLAGHAARVGFLCRTQGSDGSWGGGADGYAALVPTLSATAALLAEQAREGNDPARTRAVLAGLRAVRHWLRPGRESAMPDTVAVELLVPALLSELTGRLAPTVGPLHLPDGFDRRPLEALRTRLADGRALPEPVHHFLEALGPVAASAPFVRPAAGGVGASAAATATWLGGPDGPAASHDFLHRLQDRGGGPVPNVTPITYFEAAWVLNSLAVGGLAYDPPVELLDRLEDGLTGAGSPAGPGLPVDADDTAGVIAALLRHGRIRSPEPLLEFWAEGYFRCFIGERNPSVSTNAHVLEALSLYLARRPDDPTNLAATAAATAGWLCDRQRPDGSWWDKWHASPYYATACCVLALKVYRGSECRPPLDRAIDRAIAWIRDTQRPDGSWGRWSGTVEETSYAILAGAGDAAARRGAAFLTDPPPLAEHPPLWHGKDLYTPVTVVRAARLAALHVAAPRGSRTPDRAPGYATSR